MVWAPDSPDLWAPDSKERLALGRAVELFLAAKAAEGASPRTIEWYRMITARLVRALGPERAVDGLDPAELRAWLVELRTTLAPVSVADEVLRQLLAVASVRDRAIVLLMIDTGIRVSEVAGIRLGDLRPDGTLKVRGKGSKNRAGRLDRSDRDRPLSRPARPGTPGRRALPRPAR